VLQCVAVCNTHTYTHSDDDQKPDFELSEEYFEIIYRQFIMYMGISVFPLISGAALCCSVLQCVSMCCSALQCVAVFIMHMGISVFPVISGAALCCSVLQRVAVCYIVLQCDAVCCSRIIGVL